jgi:hypothetical protein
VSARAKSKLEWSCDEKDRDHCRNAHGCHCREISDLMEQVHGKEILVATGLRIIGRLERETRKVRP